MTEMKKQTPIRKLIACLLIIAAIVMVFPMHSSAAKTTKSDTSSDKAEATEESSDNPFKDLQKLSDDLAIPISWALGHGLTDGIEGNQFLPQSNLKLEDAVLFLYNYKEKPKYKKKTTFKDIKKDSVYYDAISWAQQKKLLSGIVKGKTFGLGSKCSKEQFSTLLYRVAGKPYVGYDGRFGDAASDGYYKDAINWAVEHNIVADYRNPDGTPRHIFGIGDSITRLEALIMIYNYEQSTKVVYSGYTPSEFVFPVLRNGTEVSDEIYNKYTNPEYCAEVFAYYALSEGWQYEAVVGALAFMWAEGMSANGTFTYEGCWTVTGPSGKVHDRTLDNVKWLEWVHSDSCREQMIAHSSYYNSSHYATGLGYCGESNSWNYAGGKWVQTLNRCDVYIAAADMMGVAWQDINFQTERALYTITSCTDDPDFRDPTNYDGEAKEYCARVFATVGYTAFPVWYDNGQLNAHLSQVEKVRPFVDAVLDHTSLLEEDLIAHETVID